MSTPLALEVRNAWEAAVRESSASDSGLAEAIRSHGPEMARASVDEGVLLDALWFSVVSSRLAFVWPELTIDVFDQLAASWLEGTPFRFESRALRGETERALRDGTRPLALPSAFWEVVQENADTESITMRIASFGGDHPLWLRDAQADAMSQHAGFEDFLAQPPMPRTRLEPLESCADGTLGHAFYKLITENGFDIEVLDPELVKDYHPAHDAANRRILQTHEIWHLVAGYNTSPLHEVAISAFQLAQFGHPYSRNFLATALTIPALTSPAFMPFLIQVTLEGWVHGRKTRPLIPIAWDSLWNSPIAEIRERWSIAPFQSAVPDMPAP